MKRRVADKSNDPSMLVTVAESIGSTLGKIAKKAEAVEASALKLKPAAKGRGSRKQVPKAKKSGKKRPGSISRLTGRKKAAAKNSRGKKASGRRSR